MNKKNTICSDDYHDYVIRDGNLVGEFELMYRNCENPWPETESDIESQATSMRTPYIINRDGFKKVFSFGCGKGAHLNWLRKQCPGIILSGCDVAPSAVAHCKKSYPFIDAWLTDMDTFIRSEIEFDVILLREVIWYILKDWGRLCNYLHQKHAGRRMIIELSFYDKQSYGNDFFDGPDEFIEKFPFEIKEIVRHHVTRTQREGMIFIDALIRTTDG